MWQEQCAVPSDPHPRIQSKSSHTSPGNSTNLLDKLRDGNKHGKGQNRRGAVRGGSGVRSLAFRNAHGGNLLGEHELTTDFSSFRLRIAAFVIGADATVPAYRAHIALSANRKHH